MPYYDHFFGSSDRLPGSTAFSTRDVDRNVDWGAHFPHASLSTHLASLLSLLTAVFLGFLDDVFDIRWRFKLPIPSPSRSPRPAVAQAHLGLAVIASVPLLTAYAASNGATDVIVPRILHLRSLLGVSSTRGILHLGPVYYLYMSLLSTFCTNGINILAGINGVEVGQALVIAVSIAINDLLFLSIDVTPLLPFPIDRPVRVGWGLARGSPELEDRHLFSLYFMLPLIGVMLALLKHNWSVDPLALHLTPH